MPKVRILHFSPHNENDGIAKYQEQYLEGMKGVEEVENAFFDISPLVFRAQTPADQHKTLRDLAFQLREFDILHIQHEFGLFKEDGFRRLVKTAKKAGKKVVVSVHLSPGYAVKPARLKGLGPHSWMQFLIDARNFRNMRSWHVKPLQEANMTLVHNQITLESLEHLGIPATRIKKIAHPVYVFNKPPASDLLATKLNKKNGDVLYATVGMMHRFKGVFDAVKALSYLPENYKLAIIGGMHPISEDVPVYNKLCDLIDERGLNERVYITGFIEDDDQMNALIQECDACVFPYDKKYYNHLSSGSINLALANHKPSITYPTDGFNELAESSEGGVVLTDTFAYYELARKLQGIDYVKQAELARKYAKKMAWPKVAHQLAAIYKQLKV